MRTGSCGKCARYVQREDQAKYWEAVKILARKTVEIMAVQAENKATLSELLEIRRGGSGGVTETQRPGFRVGAAQPGSDHIAPPDKIRPVGRLDPNNG